MTLTEIQKLIERLQIAVAHMPAHQREREQGKLLIESLAALKHLTKDDDFDGGDDLTYSLT